MQLFVALAKDQRAENLVDFGHRGFDLGPAPFFIIALSNDPQNDRRPAGVDAYAGDAVATDKVGHERFKLAFTCAEALDVPPQNDAAAGADAAECCKQITLPHLPHFRGNARQGQKSAAAATRKRVPRPWNIEIDAGRGAVRIRHDAAAFGEECLKLVALGHFALPSGKKLPDVLEGFRDHDQRAFRPAARASRVRSSAVGPSPPVEMTMLARWTARRKTSTQGCNSSPTVE